ncbi:MAG: hypothetical protein AAF236_15300, partial [Verrucomicrobiota bacterium]
MQSKWVGLIFALVLFLGGSGSLFAQADYKRYYDEDRLPRVRELMDEGHFETVVRVCDYSIERGQPSWEWRVLRFQSLAQVGRYQDAFEEARRSTALFADELAALLEIHDFYAELGLGDFVEEVLPLINQAAGAMPAKERDGADLVRLGRAALILGADPQTVLEQYYNVAKSQKAKGEVLPAGLIDAHLYSGRLALAKEDYAIAADEFRAVLDYDPDHIDATYSLAKSLQPSDSEAANQQIERVIELTKIHLGALIDKTVHLIQVERYEEAHLFLDAIESINPHYPKAHAYRAVLAELEKPETGAFEESREKALQVWAKNPEIDYL